MAAPGSYNTSPKTKLTVFSLGNRRLYSLFGSVASSRFTLESRLPLLFKKGIFRNSWYAYPITLEHRQYQVCAATHIQPDGNVASIRCWLAASELVAQGIGPGFQQIAQN